MGTGAEDQRQLMEYSISKAHANVTDSQYLRIASIWFFSKKFPT
jgi:hypothetical protein